MDIRQITPDYAVSPQIEPADIAAIKAAGFRTVICNRPDEEVTAELGAAAMRDAAEAAGLAFVDNPVNGAAHSTPIAKSRVTALLLINYPSWWIRRPSNKGDRVYMDFA